MGFEVRHKNDHTGMELLSQAERERIRANFEQWTLPYMPKPERISDASVQDIISTLAQYGGRVEVSGLGSFFIREVAQKPIYDANGNLTKMRSARRFVDFLMSKTLRDMVNEDYNYQTEPLPNSDYFIERRNLLI